MSRSKKKTIWFDKLNIEGKQWAQPEESRQSTAGSHWHCSGWSMVVDHLHRRSRNFKNLENNFCEKSSWCLKQQKEFPTGLVCGGNLAYYHIKKRF